MNILAIESSCDETAAAVVSDGTEILSNVVATSSHMNQKWGGVVPEVAARMQLEYIVPVVIEALSPFTHSGKKSISSSSKLSFDLIESDTSIQKLPGFNGQPIGYSTLIKQHIDAIAVTVGPGLIGSLLIGTEAAKTLSFITGKPLVPVNHVLAHIYANFLKTGSGIVSESKTQSSIQNNPASASRAADISYPALSLVVSGGHTELYLMNSSRQIKWLAGTLDDAAGEAFDKTARLLGFGAGGGLAIQTAACRYAQAIRKKPELKSLKLPRPMIGEESLNFSFSGLKTAVNRELSKYKSVPGLQPELPPVFSYEVQEAITDVLVAKTLRAAQMHKARSILLSGGVSANMRLREKFSARVNGSEYKLFAPPVNLCTDNAACTAAFAYFYGQQLPADSGWKTLEARPDLPVEI